MHFVHVRDRPDCCCRDVTFLVERFQGSYYCYVNVLPAKRIFCQVLSTSPEPCYSLNSVCLAAVICRCVQP